MGVRLPAEYQEVEYIATGASGNQYIATDILGQKDLIIESYQMPTNVNGDHYIFGWQGELYSGGTALQYLCHGGSFGTNYEGAYGSYFLVSNKIHNNIRYHVVSDFTSGNAKVYLDGSQIWSSTVVIPDFETERKFFLFSGMNRSGDPVYYWKGYLYSFCVKKQQRTIADFIPCYRKSDSKPGMYDLVSGEFFTNAGTGEFEVGPDVIDSISPWMVARRRALIKSPYLYKLPSPVTFNGSTDFLDTGVKLMEEDIDFSIELSFVQGQDESADYNGVFYCVTEYGSYPGISLQRFSNQTYYCIGAAGSAVSRMLTTATYSPGTEIRMVIRKAKGEANRTIDFTVNGTREETVNKSGPWEKNKNNVSLLLGCCIQTGGNRFRYWAGTINDFKIKNMVVSDAYVDKYLSAN